MSHPVDSLLVIEMVLCLIVEVQCYMLVSLHDGVCGQNHCMPFTFPPKTFYCGNFLPGISYRTGHLLIWLFFPIIGTTRDAASDQEIQLHVTHLYSQLQFSFSLALAQT